MEQQPAAPNEIASWLAPHLWRRFNRAAGWAGGALFALLLLLALFPAQIAPYDPHARVAQPMERPSARHLLGANDIGQDLLSELIWGTRASLGTGLAVAALAVGLGALAGMIGGYRSGLWSALLFRLADLSLALPFLPLVILLSAYLGPSRANVILVLALASWAGPARLVRSRVLGILSEPYIEAAHAVGCDTRRILRAHIWPGARAIALTQFVLVANSSILAEASLSFLGLGNPAAKSWGTMLYFARASGAFIGPSWQWWVLPTGLMLTLAVLSLALIGYALEQQLEPTLR